MAEGPREVTIECIRCKRMVDLIFNPETKKMEGYCPICKTDYDGVYVPLGMPEKR